MNEAPVTHDRAAIVSIGDELLIGRLRDGNAAWLSDRLARLGVEVIEHAAVGDDRGAIRRAIRRLAESATLVITTGGLGPTHDDPTRHALADALGEELVEDDEALAHLKARYVRRGAEALRANRIQAHRPVSARMLANELGTAPGLAVRLAVKDRAADVFCLPGPPNETRRMFEGSVKPALRRTTGVVEARDLRLFGLPESEVARRLDRLFDGDREVGAVTLADASTVTVRLRAAGESETARQSLDRAESAARDAFDAYIFGVDEQTLGDAVVALLKDRGQRVVAAESCTGGLVSQMITSVAGSSEVFLGGWVAYTNELKVSQLRAPGDALARCGAVSGPVAHAMAEGAIAAAADAGLDADHSVAITGIAGPGGGTSDKPVGTVFIARASRQGGADVRRFQILGDRAMVRERSAMAALAMLRFHLIGAAEQPLLWEARSSG